MSVEETYQILRGYFSDKPVNKVQVFGSFARGEANDKSDVDILITLEQTVGLFTLAGFQSDLENIFKKKIDLATSGGLSTEFYNSIKQDLKLVYERN